LSNKIQTHFYPFIQYYYYLPFLNDHENDHEHDLFTLVSAFSF